MEAFWTIVVLVIVMIFAPRMIRRLMANKYFASEDFLAHKRKLKGFVAEHNEMAEYTAEIRTRGNFLVGASSSGMHAHLAQSSNTSRYNYVRDRNLATVGAPHVHNCSLQVVRNASNDPLKYVMKYFDIKPTQEKLDAVQRVAQDVSRLEEAVENLKAREAVITSDFRPPSFIIKHFYDEFMGHVGVHLLPISIPYPTYVFEYVSAGGNSGQRTQVRFDTPTLDALTTYLGERVRFRKSAAGQRALMTSKLRNWIKSRDGHSCQICNISVAQEPHLLLEVDHIVPVSRGGLSVEDNLQALCWRCNRSKSNKL